MATAFNGNIFKEIDETVTTASTIYTAPSTSGNRSQISILTLIYKSGESTAGTIVIHKVRNGGTADNSNIIYKVSVPASVTTWQTVEFGRGHILEAADTLQVKLGTANAIVDGCCVVGSVIEIT